MTDLPPGEASGSFHSAATLIHQPGARLWPRWPRMRTSRRDCPAPCCLAPGRSHTSCAHISTRIVSASD